MVKTDDAGLAKLREVINKRIDIKKLFDQPKNVNELIKLSGGVMRDLMHLLRACADTDNPTISSDDVQYAKTELVLAYDRLVRNDEVETLKLVDEKKRATGDESYSRLLNLRLVLEYRNGKRWADVHPAVRKISWLREKLTDGG